MSIFWTGKVMLAKLDSNISLKNNKIIKVASYFQYRITQIGPGHYQIPKYHILQAKINQNIDPAMHNLNYIQMVWLWLEWREHLKPMFNSICTFQWPALVLYSTAKCQMILYCTNMYDIHVSTIFFQWYRSLSLSDTNTDISIGVWASAILIPILVSMLEIQRYQYLVLEAKVSVSDTNTDSIAHLWEYK